MHIDTCNNVIIVSGKCYLMLLECRWNRFRTLCDSNKKIGVVLVLTADLPSEQEIERWTGEPVRAVVVPTSIFITNKKGFPVLSRAHQNVVRMFLKVGQRVASRHSSLQLKNVELLSLEQCRHCHTHQVTVVVDHI